MSVLSPLLDAQTRLPVRQGGVMALGNFDGVHLGHQAVIRATVDKARALGLPTHAMTFTPHPYAFFHKELPPFRLTPLPEKIRLLKQAGAESVIVLPFTEEMAALDAESFIERILVEGCAVKHVVVGFDFVFGCGRRGNRDLLRAKLEPRGLGVTEVPRFKDKQGETISSSHIREALRQGQLVQANEMLGRPFNIEGLIETGDKRGRTLGMPTANMSLDAYVRPLFGVYAVKARHVGNDAWRQGVANIGVRPTILGAEKEVLEFHLFDFDASLYGETWEVALHHFLRPEKKFSSLSDLKTQMHADAEEAKQLLAQG